MKQELCAIKLNNLLDLQMILEIIEFPQHHEMVEKVELMSM
jgi:hypothetical protein